jgi:hypothetical protein
MNELKFEIKKNISVLSESTKGWKREVNIISWNERKPKLDIRDWDEEHKMMGKGITLSREEVTGLKKILLENDFEKLLV